MLFGFALVDHKYVPSVLEAGYVRKLLIERTFVIKKTDFNVASTLKSVLDGETGCGGGI